MRAKRFEDIEDLTRNLNRLAEEGKIEGFCVRDEGGRPCVLRHLKGALFPERYVMSAAPLVARWSTSQLPLVAFLLPCETAALVELAKLKQAMLDNLTVVSLVCEGVAGRDGQERVACRVCRRRIAQSTDMHIAFVEGVVVAAATEKGEALLDAINGQEMEWQPPAADTQAYEAFIAEKRGRMQGWEGLRSLFADCILCHNCMRVCPVCACAHCYFESRKAQGSGAVWEARIKSDAAEFAREVLWFHLGRAFHMSYLCVGCGLCGDACPAGVDVFGFFAVASDAARKRLAYEPGRNLNEPLPLTVFEQNELDDVG